MKTKPNETIATVSDQIQRLQLTYEHRIQELEQQVHSLVAELKDVVTKQELEAHLDELDLRIEQRS